jgi:hypothetical protein
VLLRIQRKNFRGRANGAIALPRGHSAWRRAVSRRLLLAVFAGGLAAALRLFAAAFAAGSLIGHRELPSKAT